MIDVKEVIRNLLHQKNDLQGEFALEDLYVVMDKKTEQAFKDYHVICEWYNLTFGAITHWETVCGMAYLATNKMHGYRVMPKDEFRQWMDDHDATII